MVIVSLPFYYLSLNLPEQIVNQGIQGEGFTSPSDVETFMRITLPFGETLFDQEIVLFDGLQLEQPGLLMALSFTFLALVIVNGLFKFVINTEKGRLGERMLRRLRFELADRVLRFPLPYLRRVRQAEVATMIKDEIEPLGGFIGDAFVNPVFLGGQALTAMVFIMVQSPWLGLVAASIVLFQAFLIPRLRVPILRLGRQRQLTARQLAGRIGEIVAGSTEIHAHDTSNYERADLVARLGAIFLIRYEIFRRKFFVKFLNNFLSQLTPFLFYVVGGWLALQGHIDIGALVAVIAAYKDLPGPIKELIDWDQQRNDVQIKYEQVVEQFQPPVILDPRIQAVDAEQGDRLIGTLQASNLTLTDENNHSILDGVSFEVPIDSHVALVGPPDSGKEALSLLLAGLDRPSSGKVVIAGKDISELPQAVTGRRLGYVGPDAYLFAMSVRDTLTYGLLHRPLRPYDLEGKAKLEKIIRAAEARRAGNPVLDLDSDWIDYEAAGASGPEDLTERLLEVIRLVELEDDVYRFGLGGTLDPESNPEMAARLLTARKALLDALAQSGDSDLVVRFDPEAYNQNATLAENLLFGKAIGPEFQPDRLAEDPYMAAALKEASLIEPFETMGLKIARTMVEIFADLPPGHPFFEQFSFIDFDDLGEFRALVTRADHAGGLPPDPEDRLRLRRLPFAYVEARHRLGLVDEQIEGKVVEARRYFAESLPDEKRALVAFYDPETFNPAASLQDNILFGRLAFGQAGAAERVGEVMATVLEKEGLKDDVMTVGLQFDVGLSGKRLNAPQRQKLALARGLVKRPDFLIVNEALGSLDGPSENRVMNAVLSAWEGRGLLWVLARPAAADRFDRVLVLRAGRLVEQGGFEELNQDGKLFHDLLQDA
jgi:putative ABC transport system ATP-binding protein